MKILYIGQYTEGTTSKMRGETIKNILTPMEFDVIDTHIPFYKTTKVFRSLGFRYKRGPLISNINTYIQKNITQSQYDLVWVDKGVYMNENTIKTLRQKAKKLIHFTPDPAFTYHQSHLFNNSVKYYDFVITTKSFELEVYYKRKNKNQVLYVTQGFDKAVHKKADMLFEEKSGVVFLGHYEKERVEVIKELLKNKVKVTLAGIKWEKFAETYKDDEYLKYLGVGVYGEDYVKTIQNAKIAWGAISKWIPELHTTRTFEIPACGTALLTEKNSETASFFNEDEAIFYNDLEDLIIKVKYYLSHDSELEILTTKGYNTVHNKAYDYESIIRNVLHKIL